MFGCDNFGKQTLVMELDTFAVLSARKENGNNQERIALV